MKIEVSNVKGFKDFLPPESLKRQAVREIIEKNFKLYGFLPVETPLIEYDELMKTDGLEEDEAVSDRFRLKDRAGRNLGLRYEFTFQLAKLLKLNPNLKLPFKRYQIGPVFRDEPTTAERFRQFTQCDADIIGDGSTDADAECLALVSSIMKGLKISAEIEINNRTLVGSLIESVQIRNKEAVMRELDKLEKIGEDNIKSNLRKYADANQILTLFKLLEKDSKFFKDNAFDGAKEIESLTQKCKAYGIKVKFNPFMMRGLGYYTGNIFEIKVQGKKETIAAGGRYDKLVGKYSGREIPAVGISFGLERISGLAEVPVKTTKVILISLDEDSETIKLAKKLRKSDISCITTFGNPSKQLEYANSLQIPYAIFIGSEEISKKKYKLKNMGTGDEKELSEKQLLTTLKKSRS